MDDRQDVTQLAQGPLHMLYVPAFDGLLCANLSALLQNYVFGITLGMVDQENKVCVMNSCLLTG